MAQSGLTCADDIVDKYNAFKLKNSKSEKFKFLMFKLSDDMKNIVMDVEGKSDSWEDFVTSLPHNAPRYITYDFDYKEHDDDRNKILFICWCPDSSPPKQKMTFASSKDAIKKKLVGIGKEIQANDTGDLNRDDIVKKLNSP